MIPLLLALAPQPPRIELKSCAVPTLAVAARCGQFSVWENPHTRAGRRIQLNLVVLPARGPERLEDPVFYFEGGPGGSATNAIEGVYPVLAAAHQHRDLVFVDLRGTGESHALRCPEAGGASVQHYFDEMFPEAYVKACLAAQDADVRWYTNAFGIDDVEQVREALGYRQINLFGTSGGTRSIQVYLKRHPASVRSAILIGVEPLDAEQPLPAPKALEAGLQAMFQACAAEPACQAAYPELPQDWARSLRRFVDGPVEATVTEPGSSRRERVRFTRGVYVDGVRHILYNLRRARQLPGVIHLAAQGNFDAYAQRELEQSLGFDQALSYGAFLTVTCAEDLRFVSEADIHRATDGTALGDYRVRRQLAACKLWPRGEGVDAGFQELARVRVPVLAISGAVDVVTPPAEGERVARALPLARHLVFPNQSHAPANLACLSRLMTDFLTAASTTGLGTGCIAETRRPAFDTSFGR